MNQFKLFEVRPDPIENGKDYTKRHVLSLSYADIETLYACPNQVEHICDVELTPTVAALLNGSTG